MPAHAEQRRAFAYALAASLILHALMLAVRFPAQNASFGHPSAPIAARLAELPAQTEAVSRAERKPPRIKRPLVPSVQKAEVQAAIAEPAVVASAPAALDDGLIARYRHELISVAVRYNRYPPQAAENGWEGDVALRVSIAPSGPPRVSVKKSSGHELLDEQAMETFRLATPQVPVPAALRGQEFDLEVRAVYSLKD
ncbi:MAG TPA: TonB family protein [Burkholderiales bacterium]|jgi:protein TonB